jgi:hypothetical protein
MLPPVAGARTNGNFAAVLLLARADFSSSSTLGLISPKPYYPYFNARITIAADNCCVPSNRGDYSLSRNRSLGARTRKEVRPFTVTALWFGHARQNSRCAPIRKPSR